MSTDEFEYLEKFLTFLKKNYSNPSGLEQISAKIDLPLDKVKAISDNALLNKWVDLEKMTRAGPLIRINYDGNKKLNRLKNTADPLPIKKESPSVHYHAKEIHIGDKINLESKSNSEDESSSTSSNIQKQLRTIAIIGTIIGAISLIAFLAFSLSGNEQGETGSSNTIQIIISIFGDITFNQGTVNESNFKNIEDVNLFTDYESGFKIEKPTNHKWYFLKDVEEFIENQGGLNLDPSYIGGVIVNRIDTVEVRVAVFDLSKIDQFNMESHLEQGFITFAENKGFNFEILKKVASPENNYGYIEVISNNSTNTRYDVIIEQVNDEKLFILQINSFQLENIPLEVSEEIKFVVNSFRILS